MGELTIRWPDAGVERVEAAKGRLDVARQRMVARGQADVVDVLAAVVDLWHDATSPWRRRLRDMHPAATGFSPEVVEAGMALGLEAWTGEAFRRMVESERRALLAGAGRRIVPHPWTSIVLAGSIPMPSLLQPMLSLALLSPVLVKPASRDRVTPRLLAESLAAVDPEIGRAIEVVAFDADDAPCLEAFLAAECIVASGSDETVGSIRARLRSTQRLVAYGHRLSVAVVDAAAVARDGAAIAGQLALDVALWDQLGCLSPAAVLVVAAAGGAVEEAAADLAGALATELERLGERLPPGEVSAAAAARIVHERDAAALRAAAGEPVRVHAGDGTSWTVVAEGDASWRGTPLHRFVRVHPVEGLDALDAALRPVARHLSSVAVAAADDETHRAIGARAAAAGASRVCAPGRMQAPPLDWPHDGRLLLAPLARVVAHEGEVD